MSDPQQNKNEDTEFKEITKVSTALGRLEHRLHKQQDIKSTLLKEYKEQVRTYKWSEINRSDVGVALLNNLLKQADSETKFKSLKKECYKLRDHLSSLLKQVIRKKITMLYSTHKYKEAVKQVLSELDIFQNSYDGYTKNIIGEYDGFFESVFFCWYGIFTVIEYPSENFNRDKAIKAFAEKQAIHTRSAKVMIRKGLSHKLAFTYYGDGKEQFIRETYDACYEVTPEKLDEYMCDEECRDAIRKKLTFETEILLEEFASQNHLNAKEMTEIIQEAKWWLTNAHKDDIEIDWDSEDTTEEGVDMMY